MGGGYVAQEEDDGKERTMTTVVNELGIGWSQFILCFIGGAIWAADGAELLIIGSVTRAVGHEWDLRAWQRGSLVSLVFVGVLFGNSASGPFGDGWGRRLPMLVSYIGIAVFSVLSASATGYYTLAVVRMLVGFSFGIGQPAFNTLLCELTPKKWGVTVNGISQSMFTFGEIYAAVLIWINDPTMKALDWRWLCIMGAIPSVIGLVSSYFTLYESPFYLAQQGRDAEAKSVLEGIRSLHKASDVSLEYTIKKKQAQTSSADAIRMVYSPALLYTTATMIYSCFVLNLAYYGSLYALPQVMQEVDMGYGPAIGLMVGALWELPGFYLSVALSSLMSAKNLVVLYLVSSTLALIAFTAGANWEGFIGGALLQSGYMGLKVMLLVGFVTVYQLSAEIYPTVARTTGVAACFAGGRVGSIIAPLLYEQVYEWSGWKAYFLIMAGSMVLNVIMMTFLHIKDPKEIDETTSLMEKATA